MESVKNEVHLHARRALLHWGERSEGWEGKGGSGLMLSFVYLRSACLLTQSTSLSNQALIIFLLIPSELPLLSI